MLGYVEGYRGGYESIQYILHEGCQHCLWPYREKTHITHPLEKGEGGVLRIAADAAPAHAIREA
jgi:hypothetical protein